MHWPASRCLADNKAQQAVSQSPHLDCLIVAAADQDCPSRCYSQAIDGLAMLHQVRYQHSPWPPGGPGHCCCGGCCCHGAAIQAGGALHEPCVEGGADGVRHLGTWGKTASSTMKVTPSASILPCATAYAASLAQQTCTSGSEPEAVTLTGLQESVDICKSSVQPPW